MGGLFFWRRGGSSTTKERQSPQWVRVRMDPSLRGTCVTPNSMALSLIHMRCMAHDNGVVGGWHSCFTRVHCRNTCGKRMLRNCVGLNNVSHYFDLLMWYCMHVNGYFLCFCPLVWPFLSRASK